MRSAEVSAATAEAGQASAAGQVTGAGRAAERGQRRPGRPRSERADRAIIDAALDLYAETGPEGLCIEKVAAHAGAGPARKTCCLTRSPRCRRRSPNPPGGRCAKTW